MPKVGGKRKKARTHKETNDQDETSTGQKIPKSFIIKRGEIPNPMKEVVGDMREVMYPHTAMKLRESDKAKLKDYLKAAGQFGVSHMILFSSTESNNYMRMIKLPEGPTITFKILSYSTHKDVLSSQKKPRVFGRNLASPLLIINGFTNIKDSPVEDNKPKANHYNVVHLMIQNMFPPLDLARAKIHNTKKAVLFNLDHESDTIDFRYYGIKVNNAGINKNIKLLLDSKKVPNLKGFNDISEYILKEQDYFSENEVEDVIEKPTQSKEGKAKTDKMTIKLYEIGPRLKLQLVKIEEGLLRGNVMYHRLIKKSKEEIEENRKKLKEKQKRKEEARKKMQEIMNKKMQEKLKKKEKKKKFLEDRKGDEDDEDEEGADEEEDYNQKIEDEDGDGVPLEYQDNPDDTYWTTKKRKGAFDLTKGTYEEESDDQDDDDEGVSEEFSDGDLGEVEEPEYY